MRVLKMNYKYIFDYNETQLSWCLRQYSTHLSLDNIELQYKMSKIWKSGKEKMIDVLLMVNLVHLLEIKINQK